EGTLPCSGRPIAEPLVPSRRQLSRTSDRQRDAGTGFLLADEAETVSVPPRSKSNAPLPIPLPLPTRAPSFVDPYRDIAACGLSENGEGAAFDAHAAEIDLGRQNGRFGLQFRMTEHDPFGEYLSSFNGVRMPGAGPNRDGESLVAMFGTLTDQCGS